MTAITKEPAQPSADAVSIRRVTSRRDRAQFIDLPFALYADSPYWVPPLRMDVAKTLNPKKNPFFEHGRIQPFLAVDESGEAIGRIAAIVNGMHLDKYADGNGFFGFFECIEDESIAHALLDAAAEWLGLLGLKGVRGPASPSLNDTAGLLVGGFDREPSILMPYNPPYYADYFASWGLERAMTMWAYYLHKKYVKIDKLRRGSSIVMRRNPSLTLRALDMDHFDEDARAVRDIYNDAWSDNWGHVPMTEAEFDHLAADMKQIVDPEIVFLLEDEGEPVAFSIALPNLNLAMRHVPSGRLLPFGLAKILAYSNFGGIHEVRMPLMGVRKAYQGRGLHAPLVLATIDRGPRIGYDACEMSWVLDSNAVLKNALEDMGGVVDKEYALYERKL